MNNEELVYLYQQGDKKALDRLIEANRGMVYKLANKYNHINRELELEDLVQEGIIGLITSAKRYSFDMDHKAKFITYAVYYIDRYINKCVNGHSSKEIKNNSLYKNSTSLNAPIDEDNTELGELIADSNNEIECLEERIYREQLRKELESVMLEATTLEERQILKLIYGWDFEPCTRTSISKLLGCYRDKVGQIEYRALKKIRRTKWGIKRLQEIYSTKRLTMYSSVANWINTMDYIITYELNK